MGLLDRGIALLSRTLFREAVAVTYRRGAQSLAVQAVRTKRKLAQTSDPAAAPQIGHEDLDWLVRRADLLPLGAGGEPRRGDRIEHVDGAETLTYEVTNPDGGPCWTFQDPTRALCRLHTLRIARAG